MRVSGKGLANIEGPHLGVALVGIGRGWPGVDKLFCNGVGTLIRPRRVQGDREIWGLGSKNGSRGFGLWG